MVGLKKHFKLKPSVFSNGMEIITHNYYDKETLSPAIGFEREMSTADPHQDVFRAFKSFRDGFREFNDHTAYEDIGESEAYNLTGKTRTSWT